MNLKFSNYCNFKSSFITLLLQIFSRTFILKAMPRLLFTCTERLDYILVNNIFSKTTLYYPFSQHSLCYVILILPEDTCFYLLNINGTHSLLIILRLQMRMNILILIVWEHSTLLMERAIYIRHIKNMKPNRATLKEL